MLANKKFAVLGALSVMVVAGAGVAMAQQLDPGITCLHGSGQALGVSLLEANYRESMWDNKTEVRLRAGKESFNLRVTDSFGTAVCEDAADLERCKFTFSPSYEGVLKISVESKVLTNESFELCSN